MLTRGLLASIVGVMTVFLIYAVYRHRRKTITWELQANELTISSPSLAAKIKAISISYDKAIEYYEALGYTYSAKKSAAQAKNKLWMHLRTSINKHTCRAYFSQFLANFKLSPEWPPPKDFPAALKDRYLLHGRSLAAHAYYAQRYEGALVPKLWSPEAVAPYIEVANRSGVFATYGTDTFFVYKVLQDYPVVNRTGIVIGSESPWIEAILLAKGRAARVLTLEYFPINSSHPQIEYVSPENFSNSWSAFAERKLDFAFTYSSLEHTGLGRYGDRLDPDGDLTELRKLSCVLPDKAMVFLGVPIGIDTVYWNAHRIYGVWRLPLMTANYDVMAVYTTARIEDPLAYASTGGALKQAIIVMRNAKLDENNAC